MQYYVYYMYSGSMPYHTFRMYMCVYTYVCTYVYTYIYRIRQNSRGGKLLRFSQFLLNRKNFPVEYFTRLGIYYYKKLLPQKFSHRIFIFVLTVKVSPSNILSYTVRICTRVRTCVYLRGYVYVSVCVPACVYLRVCVYVHI